MNTQSSGRSLAIVALLCVAILLGSCVVMSTPAPSVPPATATSVPAVGMANPASVFCKEKGGQLKIEKDATGGEFGTCVFPDGSQCEEWAFYRGECKPGQSLATATSPVAAELTETALRNASYELPDLGAIELKDGKYEQKYGEGATQVNRAELAIAALGDLNGDGVNDAAAVVWWNGGGSGTFFNLAALLNDKGTPRQVAVTALGDRTKIEALTIKEGQIVLKMVTHGPKDPLCCPSQATTRTYRLEGNALKVVSEVIATPAPTPAAGSATDATLSKVKYNPTTYRCENEPQRTMTDKNWQAYAAPEGGQGNDPAKSGQVVTFGLRNKFGDADEQYEPVALVIAPDGSTATASGTLKAADWLYLVYAKDFAGAQPTVPGLYTILWQIKGSYITCSGFQVIAAQ